MSFKSFEELPALLTVADLMDFLQISRNKAYHLARSKTLVVYRVSGQIRIQKDSLLEYLDTLQKTA